MTSREENVARFLFLFLKQLSLEFSHLKIVSNHYHHRPKKSILRHSSSSIDSNLPLNQNHYQPIPIRRQVLFTHIDLFAFDPQVPCRFVGQPSRQQLLTFESSQTSIKCLDDENLSSKRKRKRIRS